MFGWVAKVVCGLEYGLKIFARYARMRAVEDMVLRATHAFCCVCKGATRLRLSGLLGIEYSRGGYFSHLVLR